MSGKNPSLTGTYGFSRLSPFLTQYQGVSLLLLRKTQPANRDTTMPGEARIIPNLEMEKSEAY